MFLVTYLPQAAVMALFEGPIAPFSTILLVLNESSTLFNALSRYLLIEEALVDVFDGVLVEKGFEGLVSEGRVVKGGKAQKFGDGVARLGKCERKLLFVIAITQLSMRMCARPMLKEIYYGTLWC